MEEEFSSLLKILPEGWEEKAKELKALTRKRKIKTAGELLRLILIYVTEGKSFGGTKALLAMGGGEELTKWAICKRIAHSAQWLKWLCVNICRGGGLLAKAPAWLEGKDVYLLDASETVTQGEKKKYYLLHYCINLFTLAMKEMLLTGIKEGEKVGNFKEQGAGDIIIGDRAYGTIAGIESARGYGSDFILRLRGRAFTLYEINKTKINLLERLGNMKAGEYYTTEVYYKKGKELKELRLCVLRKDKESEEAGLERLKKENQRKRRGKEVSVQQKEYNKYIIVATSLKSEVSAEQVLGLYRMRWQIELTFKRLKSLFQYGQVPSKMDESARAWFYGKLLLAALSERLVNEGRFPPL